LLYFILLLSFRNLFSFKRQRGNGYQWVEIWGEIWRIKWSRNANQDILYRENLFSIKGIK